MAKRFTDTELWDKEWFMLLKPKIKCLVKFVRDKADLSGVWSPNWSIANSYIGEKVTEHDLLKIDGGQQFLKMKNGKIFCIGFIQFQYGELSEKSPVHRKILGMLKQNNLLELYYQIGSQHPIDRVQEEEEEKEEDKEEETEEEKGSELIFPFDSENFKTIWKVLTGLDKWKKKKPESLQASLNKLSRFPEIEAIEMMKNSIEGNWQGLFELKPHEKNSLYGKQQQTNPKNSRDQRVSDASALGAAAAEYLQSFDSANNGTSGPG